MRRQSADSFVLLLRTRTRAVFLWTPKCLRPRLSIASTEVRRAAWESATTERVGRRRVNWANHDRDVCLARRVRSVGRRWFITSSKWPTAFCRAAQWRRGTSLNRAAWAQAGARVPVTTTPGRNDLKTKRPRGEAKACSQQMNWTEHQFANQLYLHLFFIFR